MLTPVKNRAAKSSRLESWFSTQLVRNTVWALGGYGLRLLIQAAYFVIIARALGPSQYGGFAAVLALTGVIAPFVGVGCGSLLIKNVARDQSVFSDYWGNGLFMTAAMGLAFMLFVIAGCRLLLPHSIALPVIVCVCLSDLIFSKVLDLAAFAFQAFESLSKNAQLNVLISLSRLIGIAVLAGIVRHPSVTVWAGVYLSATIVSALIAIIWVNLTLGRPRLAVGLIRRESVEGFCFSVSLSAQTIYNDIDKTMVAQLATLSDAGIYAAAYRLIDVAFIPVRALLNAAYPNFFRHGSDGIRSSLRYGRRLLLMALPYPVLAFLAIWFGARYVPFALGREYALVTEALRWLAIIPLLKTLQFFIADALTGAGHQVLRTGAQVGVALFNILINLWVIPAYGWRGAAWSSIASDGLLTIALWSIAAALLLRQAHPLRAVEVLSEDAC